MKDSLIQFVHSIADHQPKGPMTKDQPPRTAPAISRRAIARGAAWATPTVLVGVAAPAVAASVNCTPQSAAAIQQAYAFNGNISNWTQTLNPSNAPQVSYQGTYNTVSNAAVLTADPASTAASTTTLQSPTACLAPGTYTFTFNSALYNANPRPLQLIADAVNVTTGATVGNQVSFTTTSGAITGRTNDVVTVTVSARTQIRFRYRWVFAAGQSLVGDDIGVTAPRVAKTA